MKTPNRLLVFMLVLCLSMSMLNAQSFKNAGATGLQFLKIGVGARAMGMGGAGGSLDGDATMLAWNPAGIGTINAIQISAQRTEWVAETNHNFLGVVVPVTDMVNLALHTIYVTSGDIEITTIDQPEGTGQFYDASDVCVGFTTSLRLTSQLTMAGTIKYLQERISEVTSDGIAIDAGAWYATGFRSLTIGFSIANLGFDQQFSGRPLEIRYTPPAPGEPAIKAEMQTNTFSLPLMFRASGSFDCFEMFDEKLPSHALKLAMDFIQNADTRERLAIGAEYTWDNLLSVRTGYLMNADELSWSTGAGIRFELDNILLNVDYSANALGRFGLGHRFGVVISYF